MPRPRSPRNRHSKLAWIALGVVVLGIVAFVAVKIGIDSYLRSDRFRQFLAKKAGQSLKSDVEITPLQFNGASIYSESFTAHGYPDAPFSLLSLDQARIEVSGRRFFEHVWDIDSIEVQHAAVNFGGTRFEAPPGEKKPAPPEAVRTGTLLPNRVDVKAFTLHSGDLVWPGGYMKDVSLQGDESMEDWTITAQGGALHQDRLPTLELVSLRARYNKPSLFIQDANFHEGLNGTANITGEIRPGERLDMNAHLKGISIDSLLANDWRARLSGRLSGEVHAEGNFPMPDGPNLSGALTLAEGRLQALPLLNDIASLTGLGQFKGFALTTARADFNRVPNDLTIKNLVVESAGLIRLEGTLEIKGDRLDGSFQVGVTPASLQNLPGSQEHVFTVARDGYLWTPMRVTGTTQKPKEDLTPRVERAMAAAGIETVTELITDPKGKVQEAAHGAKGLLDRALDAAGSLLNGK